MNLLGGLGRLQVENTCNNVELGVLQVENTCNGWVVADQFTDHVGMYTAEEESRRRVKSAIDSVSQCLSVRLFGVNFGRGTFTQPR